MKTSTKILIGVGVLGAGYLAWKMFTKPKPVPAPAPAPGGTVNEALTNAVQNVQTIPTNLKPGALVGSTGAKNILDKIKQNVATNTGTFSRPNITSIIKPATSTTAASLIQKPTTSANMGGLFNQSKPATSVNMGGLFNQQKPKTNSASSALMAAIANARKN
jgi:hypothetical protein